MVNTAGEKSHIFENPSLIRNGGGEILPKDDMVNIQGGFKENVKDVLKEKEIDQKLIDIFMHRFGYTQEEAKKKVKFFYIDINGEKHMGWLEKTTFYTFLEDSCYELEALMKTKNVFSNSKMAICKYRKQQQLEKENSFGYDNAILLPGFIKLSPSYFSKNLNVYSFIISILNKSSSDFFKYSETLSTIFQYLDLWFDKVSGTERVLIIEKIINICKKTNFVSYIIYIFFYKLLDFFKEDNLIINKIYNYIQINGKKYILDLFSGTKFKELCSLFPELTKEYENTVDVVNNVDNIICLKKRNDNIIEYAGSCPKMEERFYKILIDQTDENYGKTVLLYINNMLIGAVKNLGETSMLALKDVYNSQERLILKKGGVYAIDKKILRKVSQKKGRWEKININTSKNYFYPLRFIGHEHSEEHNTGKDIKNFKSFESIMKQLLPVIELNNNRVEKNMNWILYIFQNMSDKIMKLVNKS